MKNKPGPKQKKQTLKVAERKAASSTGVLGLAAAVAGLKLSLLEKKKAQKGKGRPQKQPSQEDAGDDEDDEAGLAFHEEAEEEEIPENEQIDSDEEINKKQRSGETIAKKGGNGTRKPRKNKKPDSGAPSEKTVKLAKTQNEGKVAKTSETRARLRRPGRTRARLQRKLRAMTMAQTGQASGRRRRAPAPRKRAAVSSWERACSTLSG